MMNQARGEPRPHRYDTPYPPRSTPSRVNRRLPLRSDWPEFRARTGQPESEIVRLKPRCSWQVPTDHQCLRLKKQCSLSEADLPLFKLAKHMRNLSRPLCTGTMTDTLRSVDARFIFFISSIDVHSQHIQENLGEYVPRKRGMRLLSCVFQLKVSQM